MNAQPVYVEAYVVKDDGIRVFSSADPTPPPPPPTAPAYSAPPAQHAQASGTGPRGINETGAREYLSTHHWPPGLQDTLLKNLTKIPIRFFICDDSGSMSTSDGHKLLGQGSNMKFVACSRWAELAASLQFHSGLAAAAGAPTEFRLLNGAPPIMIGDSNDPNNLSTFQALLEGSPSGGTPLCRHVREVVAKIRSMESSLRASGQKACVVILTDGESSDGDLSTAMQALKALPVWTVVRLCTDEEKVVNYWNNIDNELELDMDVLDDLAGEAAEVTEFNPWLTYGEPLHRLREFGIPIKEIDLLDEAKLTLDQIRLFASLLFGGKPDDYPHPDLSRKAFKTALDQEAHRVPAVWNPLAKRATPWIVTRKLPRAPGACVIC